MLITLWGRLANRDDRPKFEYVRKMNRFNQISFPNQYDLHCVNILDEDTLQVQRSLENVGEGTDTYSNVIVASFVTSYARLELYRGMVPVGQERLIYFDTDCIIAMEGPGWLTQAIGNCLGSTHLKSEKKNDAFWQRRSKNNCVPN